MIEISKSDISDLTLIREILADSPMKFIIFIDDLCFDSHDDSFGELKAARGKPLRKKNTTPLFTQHQTDGILSKKAFLTEKMI